jgi:D-alanine-D-alanine ligase
MRVAIVRNNRQSGVIARFGEPTLDAGMDDAAGLIVDALRTAGHTAVVCEGDMHLPDWLARFMPSTGVEARGFAFNISSGLQGEFPRVHVPAMLELCGVPYTGPGPLCLALTCDTASTRWQLERAGVPVPRFAVLQARDSTVPGLRFPLVVRPRRESPGFSPSMVRTPSQLAEAVERIADVCQQESLVEERREAGGFSAALIRNGNTVEPLPLLVDSPDGEALRFLEPSPYSQVRRAVGEMTAAAFEACGCRDAAVFRMTLDRDGNPLVASVDPSPRLTWRSVCVQAAVAAGYSYCLLIATILDAAHERYFGTVAPRFDIPRDRTPRDLPDLLSMER